MCNKKSYPLTQFSIFVINSACLKLSININFLIIYEKNLDILCSSGTNKTDIIKYNYSPHSYFSCKMFLNLWYSLNYINTYVYSKY